MALPLPPLPPLPQPQLRPLQPGVDLLRPLSRRGHGPGLILLVPPLCRPQLAIEAGIPSPLIKWAEESYAVAAIQTSLLTETPVARDLLLQALEALQSWDVCEPKGSVGVVVYESQVWNVVAPCLDQLPGLRAASVYATVTDAPTLTAITTPTVQHLAGKSKATLSRNPKSLMAYAYPAVSSETFSLPFQPDFRYHAEALAHTRTLKFFKEKMDGPWFDLEAIWDEHTYYEFENRSVEHTMSTMVQEPYVNHIPTLTGGIGRENLTAFYRDHFIWHNPPGTELELISRTVGIDRVVDEFIFKLTHDQEVDWLIPGIAPTHRPLAIPMTAIVNIRGDRLYHEHIAWDQGTVLRQLGLLPDSLPLSGGGEYRLPVFGLETSSKLRDKDAVESNTLLKSLEH